MLDFRIAIYVQGSLGYISCHRIPAVFGPFLWSFPPRAVLATFHLFLPGSGRLYVRESSCVCLDWVSFLRVQLSRLGRVSLPRAEAACRRRVRAATQDALDDADSSLQPLNSRNVRAAYQSFKLRKM